MEQKPSKLPTAGLVTISDYFWTCKEGNCLLREVVMDPSLSRALHLLNGETTNKRIGQGRVVESGLKERKETDQIIDELYLTLLLAKASESGES